jgi:hypothetical protein
MADKVSNIIKIVKQKPVSVMTSSLSAERRTASLRNAVYTLSSAYGT